MWLRQDFINCFQGEYITFPIAGFHVTEFLLWKLGCLLDEDWLEEDVLNAMAELLYFRIAAEADDVDFVYLPTLAFNDARWLYASDKPVYGPNLTAFRHLLSEEPIETITFNVWHNNHYHAFHYNSTDGSLIHGYSQHGSAPGDEGKIQLQGIGGGFGSCAVAVHNFIECRAEGATVGSYLLQWLSRQSPHGSDHVPLWSF